MVGRTTEETDETIAVDIYLFVATHKFDPINDLLLVIEPKCVSEWGYKVGAIYIQGELGTSR